jgi:hypothetical protein
MLYGARGILNLARARERKEGQHGQILVLFTMVIVILMVCAALVIDVGLLRTDGARLQNALDSGALAAAQSLPATNANVAAVKAKAVQYATDNFPGLNTSDPKFATFQCIVGADSNGLPRLIDMPAVCNVSFAVNSPKWVCTAALCWAPCDPATVTTDVCNTIVLKDSVVRPYTFGRVVGINERATDTLQAAACTGPCGPTSPVDVALVIDRTLSMQMSGSIPNLKTAAKAVLSAYDPAFQRIALGMLGPTSQHDTCAGAGGPAVKAVPMEPGATDVSFANQSSAATVSGGAASLTITRPGAATATEGDLLVAAITVIGGSGTTVTPRVSDGWTLINKTDNGTNVSLVTYYKLAGTEPASYLWNFSGSVRASGGVVRYAGVDPANPINRLGTGATGNSTAVAAPSLTTTADNTQLIGFFATAANATFTAPSGGGWTEQVDRRVTSPSNNGPATEVADYNLASTGVSGIKTATASATGQWAAQMIAIQPPTPEVYGTAIPANLGDWMPIGFTGTDGNVAKPVTYNEQYVDPSTTPPTLNPSSHLVSAIDCFTNSSATPATTLKTPMEMATYYLQTYGRPGVPKGIIIETDGTPQRGSVGNIADFTCKAAADAAAAAKAAGIEVFTIGYGVSGNCFDGTGSYPSTSYNGKATTTLLSDMSTGPAKGTTACNAAENTDGDHFFCQAVGTDLASVFRAAALALVGGTRLVQLYPQPVVTGVGGSGGSAGGTTVTITGKYFTEAYAVSFGGTPAAHFTVNSDTSITAVSPAGPANTAVDIQVSTPGGSSKITGADVYNYGP